MEHSSDFSRYLNTGIEDLIADVIKSSLKNPRETAFLLRYRRENKKNLKKRDTYQAQGKHIPPFLICSITGSCNMHCIGCYARANGLCGQNIRPELTAVQWRNIFDQAAALGISFALLAGGEPFMRPDILHEAADIKSMIFPIFTNGTLLDVDTIDMLDKNRNLVPILSLEGSREKTDERRGMGAYDAQLAVMQRLKECGILFGTSLTVTTQNIDELTSQPFLDALHAFGCRLAFYISYVPIEKGTEHLAQSEEQRLMLEQTLEELRKRYETLVFLSFPGDEQHMGGCLAGGRGFLHINPTGDAEACPFSPYSDRSLKTHTLLEVLDSPFFKRLREEGLVGGEHDGGCALFEHEARVMQLLAD